MRVAATVTRKCLKAVARVAVLTFIGFAYGGSMDRSAEELLSPGLLRFIRGGWESD